MVNDKEKWYGRLTKPPCHRFKALPHLGARSIPYGDWYVVVGIIL